jgi:hypothetical protein
VARADLVCCRNLHADDGLPNWHSGYPLWQGSEPVSSDFAVKRDPYPQRPGFATNAVFQSTSGATPHFMALVADSEYAKPTEVLRSELLTISTVFKHQTRIGSALGPVSPLRPDFLLGEVAN